MHSIANDFLTGSDLRIRTEIGCEIRRYSGRAGPSRRLDRDSAARIYMPACWNSHNHHQQRLVQIS